MRQCLFKLECYNQIENVAQFLEECVEDSEFLAQLTLIGDNGETIDVSQRIADTTQQCIAVVYNPTLGVKFADSTYDCSLKFNFICQRGWCRFILLKIILANISAIY